MGWLSKLFNLDDINQPAKPPIHGSEAGGRSNTPSPDLKNSREDARNRLKLVLMHDRTKLAPETIEQMRDELIGVISKYVEIDKDALKLDLETESNTIALVANIPVLRSRGTENLPAAGTSPATPKKSLPSTSTDSNANEELGEELGAATIPLPPSSVKQANKPAEKPMATPVS